ncbi:hypothetical protein [Cellulomonas alba]|uniref:Uncharacterized protein n=1 Tax=Cellulomonas alba TaxID=3053467 RepID=A0ABT7SH62_9CELL|nr:hypothetical protein [Cellulomonas alba]MDM7855534.1 hypothetical protein [Cellulomonas alba]
MNDLAGPVALALVGLWVAYLVPHKLRHRQQLLESRTEDRYSEALRVVAVSDRPGRAHRLERASRTASASAECAPAEARTRQLLTPGRGVPVRPAGTATGGTTVDRPLGTQDRLSAEAVRRRAQAHAARAAAVARRRGAARRRALLAGVLLVATVAAWGVVGVVTTVSWLVAAVPTVLLGSVLVLGRRASRSWAAADAEWAKRLEQERRESFAPPVTASRGTPAVAPANRTAAPAKARPDAAREVAPAPSARTAVPLVTGRAVHPSEAETQLFERIVEDRGEGEAPARHSTGATPVVRRSAPLDDAVAAADAGAARDDDEAWSPVPVPRPTYTMKPAAPRREPAPLGEVEGSTAARAAEAVPAAADIVGVPGAEQHAAVEPPAATTGSIDLDAVLAKRRASGQ